MFSVSAHQPESKALIFIKLPVYSDMFCVCVCVCVCVRVHTCMHVCVWPAGRICQISLCIVLALPRQLCFLLPVVWCVLTRLTPPEESELPETALFIPVASSFQQVGTAQGGCSMNVAWLDEHRPERVNE